MPLTQTTLGRVLSRIYDFDSGATLYLPPVERYEGLTSCAVAIAATTTSEEWQSLHAAALQQGYVNWLNIAVVSDTCDEAASQSEADLIAEFNADCGEGRWLHRMMNYLNSQS